MTPKRGCGSEDDDGASSKVKEVIRSRTVTRQIEDRTEEVWTRPLPARAWCLATMFFRGQKC